METEPNEWLTPIPQKQKLCLLFLTIFLFHKKPIMICTHKHSRQINCPWEKQSRESWLCSTADITSKSLLRIEQKKKWVFEERNRRDLTTRKSFLNSKSSFQSQKLFRKDSIDTFKQSGWWEEDGFSCKFQSFA